MSLIDEEMSTAALASLPVPEAPEILAVPLLTVTQPATPARAAPASHKEEPQRVA